MTPLCPLDPGHLRPSSRSTGTGQLNAPHCGIPCYLHEFGGEPCVLQKVVTAFYFVHILFNPRLEASCRVWHSDNSFPPETYVVEVVRNLPTSAMFDSTMTVTGQCITLPRGRHKAFGLIALIGVATPDSSPAFPTTNMSTISVSDDPRDPKAEFKMTLPDKWRTDSLGK